MSKKKRTIPIYTTSGDLGAFLVYPYIYNQIGEWIGWVTPEKQVYSVFGKYVGWLSKDPRILRKRVYEHTEPDRKPPPPPGRLRLPSTGPLAPLMSEITFSIVDVLDEAPELLPTLDFCAFTEDMD